MTWDTERAKAGRRPFAVVELDLDYCGLTYGAAPCTAAIGSSGTVKCYNTRATCQSTANYAPAAKTYRFCENVADMPRALDAIPAVLSVATQPTRLQIGTGVGARAVATITLRDCLHNDVGIDKYVTARTYNPLKQGSYFGRLLARNPYYLGRPCRVITGYLVQNASGGWVYDTSNFRTRLYFIENITPPDASGQVVITAKDLLKLADDARAQCPKPAQGRIQAGITAGAAVPISATLLPAGIGDASYSAGGPTATLRINGELFLFTRVGDALTLTARAQNFTTAAAHNAADAVQECYVASGQLLSDIAYDLLVNYAGVPAAYIDKAAWDAESAAYNVRRYGAVIAAPVGVNTLLGELAENGPAYFWWDEIAGKIVYRSLRPASSASRTLTDAGSFIAGSISIKDRLDQRLGEVWIFFGQRDPTLELTRESNYAVLLVTAGDGEGSAKYNQPAIKKIYSRWIPATARTFASEISGAAIERYNEAPKQISFSLDPKDGDLWTGSLVICKTRLVQDVDGSQQSVVYQLLEADDSHGSDRFDYLALQERYTPSATSGQRIVTVSVDTLDFNLRTAHDQLYAAPTGPVTVVCNISAGIVVGASTTSKIAFHVDSWPVGSTITINLSGRIEGCGGLGGDGGGWGGLYITINPTPGAPGGTALKTRIPITINCATGTPEVFGGAGGGGGGACGFNGAWFGGSSGGGGGGEIGGLAGHHGRNSDTGSQSPDAVDGSAGSRNAGGAGGAKPAGGGAGGAGGAPGFAGSTGGISTFGQLGAAGGAAGNAIDGISYITFVSSADVRGPQIN